MVYIYTYIYLYIFTCILFSSALRKKSLRLRAPFITDPPLPTFHRHIDCNLLSALYVYSFSQTFKEEGGGGVEQENQHSLSSLSILFSLTHSLGSYHINCLLDWVRFARKERNVLQNYHFVSMQTPLFRGKVE